MAAETTLEQMVIIGTSEEAKRLPGSGAVVDSEQLKTEVTTDINQVMKTVPGVYIREEEGDGLRPNIGIRGATGARSGKITLMEDGVLIAPGPYANPAAYYFPTTMRMSSIEVLKGAPLLRYGPQTTGGVVNMISTPIREENGGSASIGVGSHDTSDVHLHYGGRSGQWGWLVETAERNSGGFKSIDRSNRDSGHHISDYVAKLGWESATGPKQSALLKLQRSEETSNKSYLGLTDDDFDADPNRRYGLSSIDQMVNDHTGVSLSYSRALSDSTTASATLYHNEFARNWFKLFGGGSFVDDANTGDANAQGILDGSVDVAGLDYKNNNREYESRGVELNFDIDMGLHRLAVGGRLHEDEMDRFQPVDTYDQVNGSLVFQSTKAPTGSNNRLEEADATSLWITDDWQVNEALNVNLALRYEDVESKRVQYADVARTTVDKTVSNSSDEWLPGASLTYDVTPSWQLLAGVHKGFSPLGGGAKENQEPETSTNWELGGRYNTGKLFFETIGFYSDFSNKTENCSVGTPCSDGSTSGSFVNGEAVIAGLEAQLGTEFNAGSFTVPVNLAYTHTKAEISADNSVSGQQKGDRLKDVPENIFSARVGLEHPNGWNNYAVAKYIDETCVEVGCNNSSAPRQETESLFVVDYISRYQLQKNTELFLKVENVFDEQKIVSRAPDGARPNKPFSVMAGVKFDF
ncbi:TonB-dependent receptor family protein [Thiohalomonas denitrificans]|nr:TonB-dependent receptor [Thiohalomonas denitrificans]